MAEWDDVAEIWDKHVGETGDENHRYYLNPKMLRLLGTVKKKKILDLACGQGYFSRILAKRGAKVVGVDASSKFIEIAKEKTTEHLGVEFIVGGSGKLTKLNTSFDAIISNMSFHDINNIAATIKECSRVLERGGKMIFSIPHPFQDLGEFKNIKDQFYFVLSGYQRKVTMQHKMKILKNSRVKIYHRSVSFYFNELLKNGFEIFSFNEICIQADRDEPELEKIKQEIPAFLIIGAKKK